jgi:hypothetical protein
VTGKTSNGHGGRCERAEEREAGEEEEKMKKKEREKRKASSMTNHVRGVITFVCHDRVGEGVGKGGDEGRERVECVTLCGRGHYNQTRREKCEKEKVHNISKYQGEGGWPTVHNCSRLEHFPIYFGVYSSKKTKSN